MGNENTPAPEVLKPQDDNDKPKEAESMDQAKTETSAKSKSAPRPRHVTYRPSHKATFLGLGVVVAILAINIGIVAFLMQQNSGDGEGAQREEVTISGEALEQLGVSRNPVGNLGTELVVGPDASFNGSVTVASDVNVAGQLILNSKFSAADASLAKLEAGDTAVQQLNVNGDATASNLSLRQGVSVAGTAQLQGTVNVGGNMNVAGNLAVGGAFSTSQFNVSILTVGGRIVTKGSAPVVSRGTAIGSNGTVSISGNDISGTVGVNVGTGASAGILAHVTFRNPYGQTPHVVVTAIGNNGNAGGVYLSSRTSSGFVISVNGALSPGGYMIDYIVMQ